MSAAGPPRARHAFAKLVVADLDAMADFYADAYGLREIARLCERIGGEAIEEIMLSGPGQDPGAPSLILLHFPDRAPARPGELILGFTTDDLPALLDRVQAAGGSVHDPIRAMPELKLRVAFAKDPEGHLAELVETSA